MSEIDLINLDAASISNMPERELKDSYIKELIDNNYPIYVRDNYPEIYLKN